MVDFRALFYYIPMGIKSLEFVLILSLTLKRKHKVKLLVPRALFTLGSLNEPENMVHPIKKLFY